MKKLLYLLFVLCFALTLVGCGVRTANSEEEILRIITQDLDLEVSVQIIDTIELDDVILVCYMTGNEYQALTYGYAEFKKQKNGFEFLRTYSMMDRGMDLRSARYNDSYLFISNNEKSQTLRIRFKDGKEEMISVDRIPFVYYLENAINIEYHFLDKGGKELYP